MISITYSTRKENPEFKEHLLKSSGLKDIQIIEVINNGEYSLSQVYNKLIDESIYNICVCLHDDIILENSWGRKLLKDFEKYPDAAIIGKAGTIEMPESGTYWEKMNTHMVGCVFHQIEGHNYGKPYASEYSINVGEPIECVTVDGLFIAFDKTKIKERFDETFEGFHFYDHGFCIPNYLKGCKIYTTFSFDIIHKSGGVPNDQFGYNRLKFIIKYNEQLPIKIETPKIYYSKNNPIIKPSKQDLVSIIIPHIHKNELLFECIDSLLASTTYDNYEIIIADTGSSDETKQQIRDRYINCWDKLKGFDGDSNQEIKTKIRLVEFDYYNFSRINNDIVKNHLNPNTKYILFLNNDVSFIKDNDVLSKLVKTLMENNSCASCGPRLYFGEGLPIQHSGMFAYVKDNKFEITHYGINSYYRYYKGDSVPVIGCTGACLLTRYSVFVKSGMFNEGFTECFEDCYNQFKNIIMGYKNLFVSNAVCYHKESQTRNDSPEKLKRLQEDYVNILAPFVQENFEKLKPYIHIMN